MVEKVRIEKLIAPVIESNGAFLVDINIRGERNSKVVEVYVDHDNGMTANLCAVISREVLPILDTIESLKGTFNLTVSSPGLDRPIKFPRQYKRNIGNMLHVKTKSNERNETMDGELLEAMDDSIVLRLVSGDSRTIMHDTIVETLVKPRW